MFTCGQQIRLRAWRYGVRVAKGAQGLIVWHRSVWCPPRSCAAKGVREEVPNDSQDVVCDAPDSFAARVSTGVAAKAEYPAIDAKDCPIPAGEVTFGAEGNHNFVQGYKCI